MYGAEKVQYFVGDDHSMNQPLTPTISKKASFSFFDTLNYSIV